MTQAVDTISLQDRYHERTRGSAALAARARTLMPSGVAHDGRLVDPYPLYVERAQGARKWDVDGQEYVDYFGGHGSLILGHNHPAVIEAVREQLGRGTHFGACHAQEIAWAEIITQYVPSAETVRFTSSGTEATLLALRLARAFTGRPKFLRVRGHFHGWSDPMTSGYASHFDGTPTIGVAEAVTSDTILVDAEDHQALRDALSRHDVAAAIVEPTGAHFGRMPLSTEFLMDMRALTAEAGTILIFDEVVTGFRVAPGGYQSVVGITPDITTLAKILAGGLPGGAVTGKAEIFEVMDVAKYKAHGPERLSHQGTYNANPISAAAGVATLRALEDGSMCARASEAARQVRDRLNEVFANRGTGWAAYGDYSGFHVFTNPKRREINPRAFDRSILTSDLLGAAANPALIAKTRIGLLANGVDVNGHLSGWVSALHGEREIDETIAAFTNVVDYLKREGELH